MRRGPDIVVGTPGRMLDLMGTKHLRLDQVSHFVLDEADRMLDMGFIRDIRHVVAALPARRQSMLFSATMPAEVSQLADDLPARPTARRGHAAGRTAGEDRAARALRRHAPASAPCWSALLEDPALARVIVFTRTKHGANKVAEHLTAGRRPDRGACTATRASPRARNRSTRFRSGRARVLVATDIASRGIDVTGISHVINFDLPVEPESYVHRIGRTARAGASGIAISFCDDTERAALRAIERVTRTPVTVDDGHGYHANRWPASTPSPAAAAVPPGPPAPGRRRPAAGRQARRANRGGAPSRRHPTPGR